MKTNHPLPYIIAGATGAIVASAIPFLIAPSKADTKLLPFQGRLTDASGSPIGFPAKVVEFKMYDAPTGGNVKWAGEVHKLSVNGGLVNTMLGSKSGLGSVDFSSPCFLQITVDANDDGQITATDPPLLPRQSVVPAVFAIEAGDARKLAGQTWSAILADGATDPSIGFINGAKVRTGSITTGQISTDAIDSTKIANGSLKTEDMAPEILSQLIPPGTILPYGGAMTGQPPAGFKWCNGDPVSKDDYPKLWLAIGKAWGDPDLLPGNDGPLFNLPDLRGTFLRGVDGTRGQDPDNGASTTGGADGKRYAALANANSGNNVGSFQQSRFKSHNHGGWTEKPNQGGSDFYRDYTNDGSVQPSVRVIANTTWTSARGNAYLDHQHAIPPEGGSETRPYNAYVNYIIKY